MKESGNIPIITDDILYNQINNTSSKIAESFDNLKKKDFKEISIYFSKSMRKILIGFNDNNNANNEVISKCGVLLLNSSSTIVAATQLIRNGFRLEPGVLFRNLIERFCTVLYLYATPNSLKEYDVDKFDSTKSIKIAKKILPFLGSLYGQFSKNFTHVGQLHKIPQAPLEYLKDDQSLNANLLSLKSILWIYLAIIELVFNRAFNKLEYWSVIENKIYFNPSKNILKRDREFLKFKYFKEDIHKIEKV